MEKINFQDLPSTATPLNSSNLKQMQDNMENAIIPIKLVTISDTAPTTATTGDMYYNTTDNKVYTATADNTWDNGGTPRYDGFYINTNDNTLFYYNGTSLVGVVGSQTSINVKNEETTRETDVYCCNYINNKLNTKTVLWENPNPTSDFDSQNIVFNNNDFDVYEVYYYIATTNQQVLTAKSLKGHGTRLIIPTDQMQYRVLTYVEGNTYSINVVSDPSYAVPIKIIGYKDSLFK